MKQTRILTELKENKKIMYITEKITYENWCNHLYVESFFIPEYVKKQLTDLNKPIITI